MITLRLCKFLDAAERIEELPAKDANSIGYIARGIVQATLPHREPKSSTFSRTNGNLTLTMTAISPELGLPYGAIPRLLLAWVGREAVITNSRHISLGEKLSVFLRNFGLLRSGGPRGDITRLKDQAARLFSSAMSIRYCNEVESHSKNLIVADEYSLWTGFVDDSSENTWNASVTLSQTFFEELIEYPVPLDLRAYVALKASPMAIDIYSWLSYRYSYLRKSTKIPWKLLEIQFGADYARTRDFRYNFKKGLQRVGYIYPDANYHLSEEGLILLPSRTHITKR
jgi:hypothetical protein